MRLLFVVMSALMLAQCVTGGDERFRVGVSENAFVIIGVAEAADAQDPRYRMMWRKFDPAQGQFSEYDGDDAFEAHTNGGDTLRVDGIPGEFTLLEVEPGAYALGSVFGRLRDGNVDYIAQGVIEGPERPAFEVRAGEAAYLGIWEVGLDQGAAVARLWRLDESDLRAVVRAARPARGPIQLRETETRAVVCAPRRLNSYSRREVC